MARRAARPCKTAGCPGLTRNGVYCADCASQHGNAYDRERGSAAARGYGHRWRKLRLMYLRENPLCVGCGAAASEVDHIVARAAGGGDDWENLQSFCKSCHSAKTRREQRGGGV
jgi:5-methylcytosine-specific restriction protein A